jgi:hypothetical protein
LKNKLGRLISIVAISGGLLTACDQSEEATSYNDRYNYELFRVELVNDQNEVFADSLDTEGGLYIDNNRNAFKTGDKINAAFDESGDLISVELVEEGPKR